MFSAKQSLLCGGLLLTMSMMLANPVPAEVQSVGTNGFEVRETVHVAAPADKAFAALLQPARWWSSEHTFSGNAANLVLDARAGGCWCENLPDGGTVEHLHVVYVARQGVEVARRLRLPDLDREARRQRRRHHRQLRRRRICEGWVRWRSERRRPRSRRADRAIAKTHRDLSGLTATPAISKRAPRTSLATPMKAREG